MEKTESLQSIELKKRARRRLMGATALVMVATIVLPMVLDKQPKPLEPDVVVKIPPLNTSTTLGANLDLPVKTTNLTQNQGSDGTQNSANTGDSNSSGQSSAEHQKQADALAMSQNQPHTPAVVNGMETISTDPNVNPENPKAHKKPKETRSDDVQHATIEKTQPKEKPVTTEHSSTTSNGDKKYTIKLGTFTNEANAQKLKEKVGGLGVSVMVEPMKNGDGHAVTRVRAGPFNSKEEAQKTLGKLESAGITGGILTSK